MINTWQDIPGFFDFQDVYDQAAAEAKRRDILIEVGSFLGKSTAYMAERIKASPNFPLHFFAVDPWDEKDYADWWITCCNPFPHPWPVPELIGKTLWEAFHFSMRETGSHLWINQLRMKSLPAAKRFEDGSVFFVFIDADHRYEAVKDDIAAWLPKIRPGGIIAGHDYYATDWPGVAQAVDEAFPGRVEHRGNSWLVRV